MAYHASERLAAVAHEQQEARHAFLGVVAVLLGIAVAVLIFVAVWMGDSANTSAQQAKAAAAQAQAAKAHTAGMSGMAGSTAVETPSFAGTAPANADALAAAHKAYPAELPATTPGPVVDVNLNITRQVLDIAPGIRYDAWTFGGTAPGPVIHARVGQTVRVTLTNNAPMPHSVDFHAARIAPNVAFKDVDPGKSFTFSFKATTPGVFMYHCGTKPVLMHIANGMYGAIVVDPPAGTLPHADRQYVLVASEWYLASNGLKSPATLDMTKAHEMQPDWVTWNGYAGQYVKHPLTAMPGETVRFWVVDAGPSLNTAFHVVGTLLNRAWVNADLTQYERNVQTAVVPAGGGGVFDVKIDQPGLYPVVSHSFASVDEGQVGLLNVGDVAGTMSH
ncbi:MAG TPA: multicopper oxidase domain-containing protein [Gaiellaceae bacterium]|nr:multicopper oxidase domain-containing protein [Gaiellaceae bacterium]